MKNNSVMGLTLLRVGVGLFFFAFGMMKIFVLGPEAITMMMTKVLGLSGGLAVLAAWIVMLTEFVGGAAVVMGSKVPRSLYQTALLGFVVITIVGYFAANGGDMKQLLWHGQLLIMIFALMVSSPKCSMGMTGSCKA